MGGVVVGAAAVVVPVVVIVVAVHLSLLFVDFHAQSPLPLLKCDNSIACTRHMHIFIYTHALYVSVH